MRRVATLGSRIGQGKVSGIAKINPLSSLGLSLK